MIFVRGQKAVRAGENFTWNLRVLKAQLSLLNRTQDEANDIIAQVWSLIFALPLIFDLSTGLRNGSSPIRSLWSSSTSISRSSILSSARRSAKRLVAVEKSTT